MNKAATTILRMEFCKDLCNDLIIVGEFAPVYPSWARELAVQMTRLGWTKPKPAVEAE